MMARWATNQPLFEERPALIGQLKDFAVYCTWYGDKYHVDPECIRIKQARRVPFSREFCDIWSWQYEVLASRKAKVL
eukprot:1167031-Alexandrium_andersonii.AAC.1